MALDLDGEVLSFTELQESIPEVVLFEGGNYQYHPANIEGSWFDPAPNLIYF